MDDAILAFKKVCTAIDAAHTQVEYAIAELTDRTPAMPLVPEPPLDLDDKAKMFVYRILELIEEDAEDLAEQLLKVVSHLHKHMTGEWPHEVATEEEWRMFSSQGTYNEPCKVNPCTY
jgi:hypothetical protein